MKKLVYVLSNFPALTETFIAREITEIEKSSQEIQVLSLRPKKYASKEGLGSEKQSIIYSSHKFLVVAQALFYNLIRGKSLLFTVETWQDAFQILFRGNLKGFFRLLAIVFLSETLIHKFSKTLSSEDSIHFHSHFLFAASYITFRLYGIFKSDYSITIHTKSITFMNPVQITNVLENAKFINCISSELESYVKSFVKKDKGNIYLIRNGIEVDQFGFKLEREKTDFIKLIGVGSLLDKKGFDDLIRSCKELKNRKVEFICKIIGEGSERRVLEDLIQELNLESEINLVGRMPFSEVKKEMGKAEVLIMPSKTPKKSTPDGLPTVIIEAMALGTFVISTRFAGIPDIVINGETGILVEPNDYMAIANGIEWVNTNQKIKNHMILNARKLIENEYDLRKNGSRIFQLMSKQ